MSTNGIILPPLSFGQLVGVIRQVHDKLTAQGGRAVNASLTLRNWLIGLHVEEYERRGVDREAVTSQLESLVGEAVLSDICVTSVAAATQIVEATPQFRIDGKTLISSLFYNGQKAN